MPAYIVNVTVEDDQTNLDWDGPGTFYYRTDRTKALVLTDVDDPARTPAFATAADIDTLIASGDWDLPTDPFPILSALTWAGEPAPEEAP